MTPTSDPSTLSDLPSVRAAIDEAGMELVALPVRRQHLVHCAGELKRSGVEVARLPTAQPRS
jgi:chorismate mutase